MFVKIEYRRWLWFLNYIDIFMVFKRIEVFIINWFYRKLVVNWICFLEWFFNFLSIIYIDGNLSCGEVVENILFFGFFYL